ncbi:MAG: hypothetical protein R6W67_06450 [Bacteroidales bacterium]
MNKNFRMIMEFAWIVVFIMAAAALTVSAIKGDTRNIIAFSIIALISASMYLFRRHQRKKE